MKEIKGYPRGWFAAAWSSELKADEPMPLKYFGKNMVLWRDETGTPVCIDAYCPHLGAHLGIGGKVVEGRVQCPFHAWEFNGKGQCAHIPYIRNKMPKVPANKVWPVMDRNGVIFIWHDPTGAAPTWEIPQIEEYGAEGWSPWYENVITVKTHPREIIENVADSAHFPVVHRTEVTSFENIYDGHKASQNTMGTAEAPKGGLDTFDIRSTYHGPGCQISDMRGYLHSKLLLAHTPITENELHLRFAVSLNMTGARTEKFAAAYVENLLLGFHEDIEIWEHKVYRERPRLCDGDGPLGKLRLWYSQFYDHGADAHA